MDSIGSINNRPVNSIHCKPAPTRNRGGGKVALFLPDELQDFTVCDVAYSLTTEQHNRLCLLRGVVRELVPSENFLGSSLPEVVRYHCFLFYALFHSGSYFLQRRE